MSPSTASLLFRLFWVSSFEAWDSKYILFDVRHLFRSKFSVPLFLQKLTDDGFTGMGGKLWTSSYERQLPAGQSHRPQSLPALWMSFLSALLLQTYWSVQEGTNEHRHEPIQGICIWNMLFYVRLFFCFFCFLNTVLFLLKLSLVWFEMHHPRQYTLI